MPRHDYQRQLERLRGNVLDMSELVVERLELALDALGSGDEAVIERVVRGDDEINQLYLDLEQDCVDILALQQPVAGDLRFIAASFKIITDLERIADLATNLAGYARRAAVDPDATAELQEIGETAVEMVETAMGAYARDDADATYDVAERDDALDDRCEQVNDRIVRSLLERPADETTETILDDISTHLLAVRDLERVGDHAVNIAARTLYMIESDDELIY
ncbi:phosphate signaling complex protein PhoU [Natranaeroarchaeum aerophilus]|uniref:Phosphate-specific transport system accessory protein PhoU n=1 Tax=Natranaeroarchaeum aerophilus TaxID=2917711 RepID=A0AAE3FNX3_9EURY|nr:phosphate signaling complex protein PhoU [Natranaeroarchaeum aerophilus]MCL9812450.1 phosphate signaling complex protein PhoU [Natranaeroarchaeum aerophilus]